mmetsp:Transcript_12271/g.19027  ORF Transcript_12271/g.19027 Transcript_12271/m.19027 type:complete len:134 (-) Transcript_12271:88-489(-)
MIMAIRNGVRLFDFERSLDTLGEKSFAALAMVQVSVTTYSLNLFLTNFNSKQKGHRLYGLFLFSVVTSGILVASFGKSVLEMSFMQIFSQLQFSLGFLFILTINQEAHNEHINSLFEMMHGQQIFKLVLDNFN